ncbi:neuritin-like [Alligator mississippiensis]|uniref:neuritin-like n=1 Tax=Alligator mississippiensis TaxID=8496 RepID=UPI002877B01C|nr:neuritin-like [Alligator mississippiensis]
MRRPGLLPLRGAAMGRGAGAAMLLLALGYLARPLASERTCENIYRGFSDCILKLGERMAAYSDRDGDRDEGQGLHTVCGYWEEFHTCAMTALWDCQKEAASIWEMLKKESRKIKFQGSLFDLCSPSGSRSFSLTNISNLSVLSISLMVIWLNL